MAKATKAAAKVEATTQEGAPASAPAAGPATAPAADAPQLTIADLQLLAQAIDIASSRGAYRAGEMGDVGTVYNKLTAFLTAIAKQRQEAAK